MMTLEDHLANLWSEVAELKRRQSNVLRHGRVTDVDAKKHLVRLRMNPDSDQEEFKTAWIPYGQMAGDYKFHNPPTVGQIMTAFAPSGELGQAVAMPFTWTEKFESPSEKEDEHIITFGKFKMTIKKDSAVIELGKTSVKWEDEALTFTGPKGQFKMDRLDLEDGAADKVAGDNGSLVNKSSKVYVAAAEPANPTALDKEP